jgi:hypothetical protein
VIKVLKGRETTHILAIWMEREMVIVKMNNWGNLPQYWPLSPSHSWEGKTSTRRKHSILMIHNPRHLLTENTAVFSVPLNEDFLLCLSFIAHCHF